MTLQEKLQSELTSLAKEKNNSKKELLKVVLAEISREKSKIVSDEVVLRILKKMKFNANGCGNLEEVSILDVYIPQIMCETKLRTIIENIITENEFSGMKDMGKVMGAIRNSEFANSIDSKIASGIVKELLM